MFYDLNNKTILKYSLDVDLNSLGKHESSLRYNAVITLKSVKIHTIKRLDEDIVRIKGDLEYIVRVNGTAKQQKHPLNMKVYSSHSAESMEDLDYFNQKLTPFEEDTVQVNKYLKVVTSNEPIEKLEYA